MKFKIKHNNLHWKFAVLVFTIIIIILLTVFIGRVFEGKIIEKKNMMNEVMYNNIDYSSIDSDFDITTLNSTKVLIGNPDADVTIFIYGDFECPFTKKFYRTTYKNLKKDYVDTGKANLLFISFPATKFHKYSLIEAEAYECFREQNKSNEIFDELFTHKSKTKDSLIEFAMNTSIDVGQFLDCYGNDKYKDEILHNINNARDLGIKVTPTVIIENEKIEGAKPYVIYENAIISALK